MHPSSCTILHAKLSELPEKKQNELLQFLPENTAKCVRENPSFKKGIDPKLFSSDTIFDSVHYSWFLPTLKMYEEEERLIFLSALDDEMRKQLKPHLNIHEKLPSLKKPLKAFLRLLLEMSLLGEEDTLLPIAYLPKSELNALLKLNKVELTKLIDYLSLYDLAKEMRQTLDPRILKNIEKALSPDYRAFVKKIMHLVPNAGFQKIGLSHWKGDKETLKKALHQRGMRRLKIALSHEHKDLLFYISHVLDIGRGGYLNKKPEKNVARANYLAMVECVMGALKELK